MTALDGRDLLPLLTGRPRRRERGTLFWQIDLMPKMQRHEPKPRPFATEAARRGRWKLLAFNGKPVELFDLEADPTRADEPARGTNRDRGSSSERSSPPGWPSPSRVRQDRLKQAPHGAGTASSDEERPSTAEEEALSQELTKREDPRCIMPGRWIARLGAVCVALTIFGGPLPSPATSRVVAAEPKRPNIVLIFSDDHAYQAISAYGDPRKLLDTPNLDRLGQRRDAVQPLRRAQLDLRPEPGHGADRQVQPPQRLLQQHQQQVRRLADDVPEAAPGRGLPDRRRRQVAPRCPTRPASTTGTSCRGRGPTTTRR